MLSRSGSWCCVSVLFAGVAWCQTADSGKPLRVRADVYAGYSRVGPSAYAFVTPNPADQGFGLGGDAYFSKWLAVAAEAQWMHVTYDAEDNSKSVTMLGGPRLFFPVGSHRVIIPFLDFLGGAFTYDNVMGFSNPFTGTVSPAFAIDGGVDLRVTGRVYVRGQAGYLHSGLSPVYRLDQRFTENGHSRLLIEAVWHF